MIDTVIPSNCCLCGNCAEKCPTHAITFSQEFHTFRYPVIDKQQCIGCNLCEKVCPVLMPLPRQESIISGEARNRDFEVARTSSSGGIFSALAMEVYRQGGIVVGAAYNENRAVSHILTTTEKELSRLRGSKYTQSTLEGCFSRIEAALKQGQLVLFSGCPCQSAALRCYLGHNYDELYVVDFICHGMLSNEMFQLYLASLEKKSHSPIASFVFRDKTNGWADSGPRVRFVNGKSKTWPLYEDLYMQGYFRNLCMKESCYNCPFKDFHSGSDLTMGDFWGAEVLDPDFFEDSGVSLISVQTQKGLQLLNEVRESLYWKELPLSVLTKHNQGLYHPFKKNPESEKYWALAQSKGYLEALRKMSRPTLIEQLKRIYHHWKFKIKK